MGVKNFAAYKVTEHAKERILTRFNITNKEFDSWISRLLSQSTFVERQEGFREKYRLNDIVLIIETRQKQVITVYSQNEHDDISFKAATNPEIKSVINEALDLMIKQKKVRTAGKIYDNIQAMMDYCERMKSPHVNHRFADVAWEQLLKEFNEIRKTLDGSMQVISEAKQKIAEG
ncbi:hypothetical protein [Limosilactobacillus reuteri]|uniref:hypothetical protein n=1 Tax=Limosilactobacillus reuteri TaxID=1598 RepID=UPI002B05CF4A|nr:hypothetical protein [Limosilactobacillus reuteri]